MNAQISNYDCSSMTISESEFFDNLESAPPVNTFFNNYLPINLIDIILGYHLSECKVQLISDRDVRRFSGDEYNLNNENGWSGYNFKTIFAIPNLADLGPLDELKFLIYTESTILKNHDSGEKEIEYESDGEGESCFFGLSFETQKNGLTPETLHKAYTIFVETIQQNDMNGQSIYPADPEDIQSKEEWQKLCALIFSSGIED